MTSSFIGFGLIAWIIRRGWFYAGLGVEKHSNATAFALLLLAGPTFGFFVAPLFAAISRRFESEADDFAVHESGPGAMANALLKLYDQNATPLASDPIYSAFYDSHPPPVARIQRLRAGVLAPGAEPAEPKG